MSRSLVDDIGGLTFGAIVVAWLFQILGLSPTLILNAIASTFLGR